MQALLGLFILTSMIGVPVGLLMCLSAAKRDLGKTIALGSVASFVLMVGIVIARGVPASPTQAAASTIDVEPKPASLSRSDMLANFRIRGLTWEKDGFGTVMTASFFLHNDNPMAMKDVEVTCSSSGPSGSIIDTNSRTVFEVVRQRSFLQIDKINMGFIRSEAVQTKCRVTGFSRA